jgi:hypothetical protein
MSTIDGQRLVHDVDAAGPTVWQAHRAVRAARLSHCRHGRARPVHRWRRVRRPPVSQYRPVDVSDATAQSLTTRSDFQRKRGPVTTVVTATVAVSLLYVGFIRVFEPDANHRVLLIGVCLIAGAAAVCLNAFTLGAMTEPARDPEGADRRVQHQR